MSGDSGSSARRSKWLTEALADGRVSAVRSNRPRAVDLIAQATTHVASARTLSTVDPPLAVAACHDAIRKALDAHAGASGHRIENRPGHHRTVLDYAEHQLGGVLSAEDVREADRLRRRRHKTEYGAIPSGALTEPEIARHADVAQRIVAAVADALEAAQET